MQVEAITFLLNAVEELTLQVLKTTAEISPLQFQA